jgi:hypothetical protein
MRCARAGQGGGRGRSYVVEARRSAVDDALERLEVRAATARADHACAEPARCSMRACAAGLAQLYAT